MPGSVPQALPGLRPVAWLGESEAKSQGFWGKLYNTSPKIWTSKVSQASQCYFQLRPCSGRHLLRVQNEQNYREGLLWPRQAHRCSTGIFLSLQEGLLKTKSSWLVHVVHCTEVLILGICFLISFSSDCNIVIFHTGHSSNSNEMDFWSAGWRLKHPGIVELSMFWFSADWSLERTDLVEFWIFFFSVCGCLWWNPMFYSAGNNYCPEF